MTIPGSGHGEGFSPTPSYADRRPQGQYLGDITRFADAGLSPQRRAPWHDRLLLPGQTSESEECEPEVWLSPPAARKVEVLVEHGLGQRDGFGMILLHAEMREDDDGGLEATDTSWR